MSVWKIKTDIITSIAVSPRLSKVALLLLSIICEIKKLKGPIILQLFQFARINLAEI
jgi:hypothetical protein